MPRLRLLAALMPVCLLSLACSNLQQPTAAIKAMNLGSADEKGFTMNFDVDVTNPNSVALPISNTDYTLALGDVKVLEGKAKPADSIPANGTASVMLPVQVTYQNLFAAEKAIRASGGDVPYAFDGALAFNAGGLIPGQGLRVPLNYKGRLPVGQILKDPMILMRSPAARELAAKALGGLMGR
ncbi:MAG: LEA type 2 family protein [Tepidisphaeraceae bacterium]